mgnify:CR=1 FL=1
MFSGIHFKLIGVGLVLLAAAYILLGQGPVENPLSKTVAPVILILVYCVLFPFAILVREKKNSERKQ